MSTDLEFHINQLRIVDSHEHLLNEYGWTTQGSGDVLSDLFSHYAHDDLISAGASPQAVKRLADGNDPDVEGRWADVQQAFHAIEHTGYGQAVLLTAKHLYDMDDITPGACRDAAGKLAAFRKPGGRKHILCDLAGIDHVQIDNFVRPCPPDETDRDFFLHDLSWAELARGEINVDALASETDITVTNLSSLGQVCEALFQRFGPTAIAVKTQHAYTRTLDFVSRSDADAEKALGRVLRGGDIATPENRLCLGDWLLMQAARLAGEYNLPIKIHTGYYAGTNYMHPAKINPGRLAPLLQAYPDTRFVLMHIGYPYGPEMVALTKHFANVFADLCWAWSIDPYSTGRFVRSFLHAAPINKLFAFGGDAFHPTSSYAYALQARRYLARALGEEVAAGDLSEAQARQVATRVLRENQLAFFDLAGTRAALAKASPSPQ